MVWFGCVCPARHAAAGRRASTIARWERTARASCSRAPKGVSAKKEVRFVRRAVPSRQLYGLVSERFLHFVRKLKSSSECRRRRMTQCRQMEPPHRTNLTRFLHEWENERGRTTCTRTLWQFWASSVRLRGVTMSQNQSRARLREPRGTDRRPARSSSRTISPNRSGAHLAATAPPHSRSQKLPRIAQPTPFVTSSQPPTRPARLPRAKNGNTSP